MKIVIAGAGAVGTHLSKLLSTENHDCVLIDDDEERLLSVDANYDIMVVNASPTNIKTLKDAGAGGADLFVGVTRYESRNLLACMLAHQLGTKKTVARIDNYEYLSPQNQQMFKQLGVDSLVYPEVLAAQDIISGLRLSWVRQRLDIHDGALTLLGIKLRQDCTILNRPLKELCGPEDPYLIVAIRRGDDTLIPGGMDELEVGDLAYFMTMPEQIPYIRHLVGKANYEDVHNVIIMGGGKTSIRAALIMPDNMHVKIIESDAARCEFINQYVDRSNAMVIHGDGRDLNLLEEEGIHRTQAFVALTGNAETNILACLAAKKLGVRKTVAMVENLDYVSMAESLDIGTIINKKTVAASHIFQMMLRADVRNLRTLMLADCEVAEFVAAEGARVTRKKVKDLGLPSGITIGGLVRNDHGILVNGNTQIETGDSVLVFCHQHNLEKVEKFFKRLTIW
ncbi:MAG: Trk system potassium transporter TrkA [Prevotella sp.]|nr:Trk system potassium transporter TrkA [Prevotella sp.]